jgi:CheY-like chemotaxis protein
MDEVIQALESYESAAKDPARAQAAIPKDEFADHDAIFVPFETLEVTTASINLVPEAKPQPTKQVLCVETQTDIQDAFRKFLSKMGYRVFLVSDAERAAERYRESPPDAVIFDVDGLGEEGIDAFLDMHEKAHEDGQELLAVVLLGPKQHALKEKLPTDDRLIVLGKPIKMKQIQDAMTELMAAR